MSFIVSSFTKLLCILLSGELSRSFLRITNKSFVRDVTMNFFKPIFSFSVTKDDDNTLLGSIPQRAKQFLRKLPRRLIAR